ncbi:MAG: hypervirulence associated TUDOR domain-containing protein [Pseudooceanicola sp.]
MKQGTKVCWNWGDGTAEGVVKTTYDHKVTRKLQGAEVTRKGSRDDLALLIEQVDGDQVLKLASEVKAI